MDFWALIKIFLRRKWLLITVPIISGAAAYTLQLYSPKSYSSAAQITTGITIQDDLVHTNKYFNPYEISVTFDNLIESIKSRPVINLLSYRLLLHDLESTEKPFRHVSPETHAKLQLDPADFTEFKTIVSGMLTEFRSLDPNVPVEKKILRFLDEQRYDYNSVLDDLKVGRLNKTDFISIKYTSENKYLSAFLVNTLSEEFIRFYTHQKSNQSDVSLTSLETILKQKKEILDEKVNTLKNYKSENKLIDSDIEKEAIIKQINTYEALVEEERLKLRAVQLSLQNVNSRVEGYGKDGLTPGAQNTYLVSMKERIDRLNERYITDGSRNQTLLDSLKTLRARYQDELVKAGAAAASSTFDIGELKEKKNQLEVDVSIAQSNLSLLESKLKSLRYSIGDFANVEASAAVLEHEIQIARQEYVDAQDKFSKAKETAISSNVKIKQVLFGEPADKPESSKAIVFTVFGAILSFVVCVAFILVIEFADSRLKTPGTFKKMTKLRLAGSLNSMNGKGGINLNALFSGLPTNPESSMFRHFLRKIRYEIESLNGKVFLVTSTKKGEGKSFFIVALAYSLSLVRKRVLIIDTNLRNNSLTQRLMPKQDPKYLLTYREPISGNLVRVSRDHANGNNGSFQEPESMDNKNEEKNGTKTHANLVVKTANNYIDIIGSNKSELSPSEVLSGLDFDVLINILRADYDYIFLEGASLNEFSDSKELVQYVDYILPVFSAKSQVKDIDKESISFLKSMNSKLGPSVLNMVEKEDLIS